MNDYLQSLRIKLHNIARSLQKKLNNINGVLQRQINKNIYTRILFTNVAVYIAALATLAVFSGVMVKQVISDQVKQDLLRKAKRVNFALTQEQDFTVESGDPTHAEQNLLRFMAESFDARITVFVPKGMILKTSAEHDVLPGSKVDAKYVELLAGGEANVFYEIDGETGQLSCIAVIPMGNPEDTRKAANKGIILQTQPVNLDLALNKMFLSLFIGGTVILIFIVVISVYLAMRISGPISRLAAGVAEISRENLILNDDGRPPDEINILVGQINKLAERLKKMQTDSARMEEERARLFAEISHELRTPLTAVLGFTEAIRDEIVEDETLRRKYIEMIYNQTLHVTRLVDDIMSLSRLESGNINVSRLPLDLVALAGGVVMSMEGMAKTRNDIILFEKKTEKAVVAGDVDRMEQVLRNLLKNAVKATENGTIKVGVELLHMQAVLTIGDNGIGIPSDEIPYIWDRFYRCSNQRTTTMEEKGTGLGLVIVKKLVQMQGGTIEVMSQLGKGTTFRIVFPIVEDI